MRTCIAKKMDVVRFAVERRRIKADGRELFYVGADGRSDAVPHKLSDRPDTRCSHPFMKHGTRLQIPHMCHAGSSMRDAEIIETELMEISAILDDTIKLERIIAWCASHPDEVPFALHQLLSRHHKEPKKSSA